MCVDTTSIMTLPSCSNGILLRGAPSGSGAPFGLLNGNLSSSHSLVAVRDALGSH